MSGGAQKERLGEGEGETGRRRRRRKYQKKGCNIRAGHE